MVKITNWKQGGVRETVMVVRKFGNWDIGFIRYGQNPKTFLMIRGVSYGENPIIYPHIHPMRVGYDRPERIAQSVKNWLYKNAKEIYMIQRKLNRQRGSSYLQ